MSRRSWIRTSLLILFLAGPATGSLLSLLEVLRDGVGGVQGLGQVRALALSPDGIHLYAAGTATDSLAVFSGVDTATLAFGAVYEQDDDNGVFALTDPSSVVVSPDGTQVYVTSESDDALAVFSRDATLDTLQFIAGEAKENGIGGVTGLDGPTGVAVSGDDRNVYVSAFNSSSVAVFIRDATTDQIAFVESESDGVNGVEGLEGATSVTVSGDGKHVYATSSTGSSVVVFDRDPATGELGYASKVTDGVDGVDGLAGAKRAVVSPDGLHVYVTGSAESALAAFDRDATTGALTLNAVYRDGVDGIDGLASAAGVAINPSGTRVLVTGPGEDALAVFRRTPSTGALALWEVLRDGVGGVDGLAGAVDVVATDEQAFVAAYGEDAVSRFYLALCDGNEATGDSDGDGFCDDIDLCMGDDLTGDGDGDGVCDDLDVCYGYPDTDDMDGDGVPDACDLCVGDNATGDGDADGVCDDMDACPGFADHLDADGDGLPDGCDACVGDNATGDSDTDGVCNDLDVCAGFPDGSDADGDGVPDGCDVCIGDDATGDSDGDGVCNDADACYGYPDSSDADGDGVPDLCDLCTGLNATGDADGDGVCGDLDCAPADPNSSALDTCGVCGGDGTSCVVFSDGFESGSTTAWTSTVSG